MYYTIFQYFAEYFMTEQSKSKHQLLESSGNVPIKAWIDGVTLEGEAHAQLQNISKLDFIFQHIAVMPDVHLGKGATVGSVIPTVNAIIPAAVGVDLGCGMIAVETNLKACRLPNKLSKVRSAIEQAVPHGMSQAGKNHLRGGWRDVPSIVVKAWETLDRNFNQICDKYPIIAKTNNINHLGTLGSGNHFIEVCIDEKDDVWFMLHSGSRGVGNAIGQMFISLAKKDMLRNNVHLPDKDLAYLKEGSEHFEDYVSAVKWAQSYAQINREIMMQLTIAAFRNVIPANFELTQMAVNCHHNYISHEWHFGHQVYVTRKGAVSARRGELGIIPGSMGAKSYIVRGLGNAQSFHSCSHGAGRKMSRTKAKKKYSISDHINATKHVECRKDKNVIDETPMAYKDIDKVMAAQDDLVEVLHTLKQVVCVKG